VRRQRITVCSCDLPLRARIRLWAEEEIHLGHLLPTAGNLLEAVLHRGELISREMTGAIP
jgi:hypothetical protein